MGEKPTWEVAVSDWHEAVNGVDLAWVVEVVTDPVEVLGPRGAGVISATEFAGWVERSRVSLEPYRGIPSLIESLLSSSGRRGPRAMSGQSPWTS